MKSTHKPPAMAYVPGLLIMALAAVLFGVMRDISPVMALSLAGLPAAMGLAGVFDVMITERFSAGRMVKMGSVLYVIIFGLMVFLSR